MGTHLRRLLTCAALALIGSALIAPATAVAASPSARHATKPLPRITISGKVLQGDPKSFRAVGTVNRKAIFEQIPAIRTARIERISRDSARYHFLIYEANRVFQHAVEDAARAAHVDLVVETGGVAAAGIEIIDLTEATKKAIAPSR